MSGSRKLSLFLQKVYGVLADYFTGAGPEKMGSDSGQLSKGKSGTYT